MLQFKNIFTEILKLIFDQATKYCILGKKVYKINHAYFKIHSDIYIYFSEL